MTWSTKKCKFMCNAKKISEFLTIKDDITMVKIGTIYEKVNITVRF